MSAGRRRDLIVFQRFGTSEDAFGEPSAGAEPEKIGEAYADISYGRGEERRGAALESAKVPATFRVLATSMTRMIGTSDEIAFDGANWDIESNVPYNRRWRDITATRQA